MSNHIKLFSILALSAVLALPMSFLIEEVITNFGNLNMLIKTVSPLLGFVLTALILWTAHKFLSR